MSNNSNYIQATENVQQPKKYYSYLYEIKHLPTGLLYVGSRSKQSVLKKFEDCYTDNYLGSSSLEEGPFSNTDTKTNPQDYAKTILKVFYDEDAKKASRYEHGSNGLIMTYWNLYGKDKVLNQHCVLNDGSKVFSNAGQNPYANKTEEEMAIIKQKLSEANKGQNPYANKNEAELLVIKQKISDSAKKAHQNKTKEEKEEIKQKKIDTWDNKTEEEKEEISQKKSDSGKKAHQNMTEKQKVEIKQKKIDTWNSKTEEEKEEISQKFKGENNPMFGRNPLEGKSEEEIAAIGKKHSIAISGEGNGMFGQGHKIAAEKNGSCTQYRHPYKFDFIGNGNKISHDIRKNYPNEKQWNQLTIKERQSYKVVSPE